MTLEERMERLEAAFHVVEKTLQDVPKKMEAKWLVTIFIGLFLSYGTGIWWAATMSNSLSTLTYAVQIRGENLLVTIPALATRVTVNERDIERHDKILNQLLQEKTH